MTEVATSGWIRPQPESVVGFAILFLLFVLSGYVVHAHIRPRRLPWLKTGIVGLLFTIAIGYGSATGLWLVDRAGISAPYASGPPPTASHDRDTSLGAPDREPPFTIEHPSLEPPVAPDLPIIPTPDRAENA